jgi:predicted nucleic acid-binding protein
VRVVIADASPLHYLVLIKQVDILPALFKKIIIPQVVQTELTHSEAPGSVSRWMSDPPSWIEISALDASRRDPSLDSLDEGERSAIELAIALNADLLLIDERKGAALARVKGLAVTGTLGIIELAATRGLLDLKESLRRLQETSFHCRQE